MMCTLIMEEGTIRARPEKMKKVDVAVRPVLSKEKKRKKRKGGANEQKKELARVELFVNAFEAVEVDRVIEALKVVLLWYMLRELERAETSESEATNTLVKPIKENPMKRATKEPLGQWLNRQGARFAEGSTPEEVKMAFGGHKVPDSRSEYGRESRTNEETIPKPLLLFDIEAQARVILIKFMSSQSNGVQDGWVKLRMAKAEATHTSEASSELEATKGGARLEATRSELLRVRDELKSTWVNLTLASLTEVVEVSKRLLRDKELMRGHVAEEDMVKLSIRVSKLEVTKLNAAQS
ncbi:hypothetical protein ACLOJK_023239 [Asimina triloba]